MTARDPITLLNAALEGRYHIESELGEGGMATVYLADDLKHERKVALKVLKPELAAVVGAERFLAEIKTTANLQHPHILPLFDSGEADGFLFYVMPYVEGESLRERVDREKQLSVDEAVAITRKISDALDYAHGRGVIHRDVKPGNVLLSERGEPLVADFGIALAVAQAGGGRVTETGLSLGTPHYMSPEQATGDRDVDARSDVYALGCVLYEMLAGEPPFSAATAQAILTKILTMDAPRVTMVRRAVPANVGAAIQMALEKLPADRFPSADAFRAAIDDEGFTYATRTRAQPAAAPTPHSAPATTAAGPRRLAWPLAMAVVAALGLWGWLRPTSNDLPDHPTRLSIELGDIVHDAIWDKVLVSPDGSRFATAGRVDGRRALFWRDAADEAFREIPGTDDAAVPAFSPDGSSLVYVVQDELLRVSLAGGAPLPVVPRGAISTREPHWGDSGDIVFSGPTGMYLVSENGGTPRLILDGPWGDFRQPQLLPGGRGVLGARESSGGIVLLDLETDSVTELVPQGHGPQYVETGHVLYGDDAGQLWAFRFDVEHLQELDDPVPILPGLTRSRGVFVRYSVSSNGTLVYETGGGGETDVRQMVFVGLDGGEEVPDFAPRDFDDLRWSPDGESVAYTSNSDGQFADIFTYDVVLGTRPRPLTFEGNNVRPVWSPDGSMIAFTSFRDGTDGSDVFVKSLDDSPAELLISLPDFQNVAQWPSDDVILFEQGSGSRDLWFLDLSGDSVIARDYLTSEDRLVHPRLSPDGDLVAYTSSESGRFEVYVRSFPDAGAPELISEGSGSDPMWSPDGSTIYYWTLAPPGVPIRLIAARIQRGPPFVVVSSDTLLRGSYDRGHSDLHPDGDRIVTTRPVESAIPDAEVAGARTWVVVNWFEELLERVGGS